MQRRLSNISFSPAFAFAASDETVNALRKVMSTAEAVKAEDSTPASYAAFKDAYARMIAAANRANMIRAAANGRPNPYKDFAGVIKEKPAQDLTGAIQKSLAHLVKK